MGEQMECSAVEFKLVCDKPTFCSGKHTGSQMTVDTTGLQHTVKQNDSRGFHSYDPERPSNLLGLLVPLRYPAQDAAVELLVLISEQAKNAVEELVDLVLVLLVQHRKCVSTDKPNVNDS